MKRLSPILLVFGLLLACDQPNTETQTEDPYIWLEEVEGEDALDWVKEKNSKTEGLLTNRPDFDPIYQKNLEIRNSDERIAYPSITGNYVYNFWKDDVYERGIWRRMLIDDYTAKKDSWELILNLDSLSELEGKLWVFKGASFLHGSDDLCMVRLSDGGGDAVEIREFNIAQRAFVEDGFFVPNAKGGVSWQDENTLLISSDFGPGTVTTSGYPSTVKLWERGNTLDDAQTIFEGDSSDVGVFQSVSNTSTTQHLIVYRAITFYTSEIYLMQGDELKKIDIPEDAGLETFMGDRAIVSLKSDWMIDDETFKTGSLVTFNVEKFMSGKKEVKIVFEPDAKTSYNGVAVTKDGLLINLLEDVQNKLFAYQINEDGITRERIQTPDFGSISIISSSNSRSDYFFTYSNFLIPTTLYHGREMEFSEIKSQPSYFDAEKYQINQYFVASKDGTQIPYFVVGPKDMVLDGRQPTLLNAYGGFEISRKPSYSATRGKSWLERGGVYVLANIRGGGEYGPAWHQAGLKEKRQNIYDDFHAVAEDLINRKITNPEQLGIMGGSNGGLLVGVAFTQRPELYNAVVCAVPLLDMKRFNKLLAGASWMGEYGNPDIPEQWEYIKQYSPYHNIDQDKEYPEVLFLTSTKDDRVHPGHARKMSAKMDGMGHKHLYFETIEGGHGAATTNDQLAYRDALTYAYLHSKLNPTIEKK
ncbi:MAG: S9 family peptidase [Cyclobacteriaceae bacterium]